MTIPEAFAKLGLVSSLLKWWIFVIRFFVTFWTTRYCGLNYVCSLPSYHKALSNREWNANSLKWNIFFILLQCVTLIFTYKVFAIHLYLKVRILKFGDSLFLGSITVVLSVFPKKREERGLISRPAVSNRAYLFHNSENQCPYSSPIPHVIFFFFIHSTVWRAKRSALENSHFSHCLRWWPAFKYKLRKIAIISGLIHCKMLLIM